MTTSIRTIVLKIGVLLVFVGYGAAGAQTRRALLVGIDEYTRPSSHGVHQLSDRTRTRLQQIRGRPSRKSLMNLDGAVNDAWQLQNLLVRQYGFRKENVELLMNEQATAERMRRK
jgi:hypothetical protein